MPDAPIATDSSTRSDRVAESQRLEHNPDTGHILRQITPQDRSAAYARQDAERQSSANHPALPPLQIGRADDAERQSANHPTHASHHAERQNAINHPSCAPHDAARQSGSNHPAHASHHAERQTASNHPAHASHDADRPTASHAPHAPHDATRQSAAHHSAPAHNREQHPSHGLTLNEAICPPVPPPPLYSDAEDMGEPLGPIACYTPHNQ